METPAHHDRSYPLSSGAVTYRRLGLSSDGGVLILREIEKGLGLAAMLSACMPDACVQSRVIHTTPT